MPTPLKVSKSPPTTGQFIGVWKYNNHLWSDVFRWESGSLLRLNKDANNSLTWSDVSESFSGLKITYLQLP